MRGIQIPRVATTPEVGGDLDGGPWQDAPWHGDFFRVDRPDLAADPPTSFCMLHDGERLFFAVRADEPQMEQIRAHAAQADRPDAFWRFNQVTLHIDSEGLARSRANLALDCLGNRLSGWERGRAFYRKWDHKAEHAAQIHDDGWSVRLAMPLHVLKFSGELNQWRINVVRKRCFDPETADEDSACSFFAGPGAADPSNLVPAELEGLDATDVPWSVELAGGTCAGDEASGYSLQQRLRIINRGPASLAVHIHCRLEDDETAFEREFGAGETRDEPVELRSSQPTALLHVTLTDPESSRPRYQHLYFVDEQELSWKPHMIRRLDGHGGATSHPADYQFMPRWNGLKVTPYGMALMDNGEIAIGGVAYIRHHERDVQTLFTFSRDGGATWSEYYPVEGFTGRPMMLAYLGSGRLTFAFTSNRFFSSDYGRTWEREQQPSASNGHPFHTEGNALVDRDENGNATRIAEVGFNFGDGTWPESGEIPFMRWSTDGGHSWEDETQPAAWSWPELHMGKTYTRGTGEGSLVRAANGWIVAALRTSLHPRYFNHPFCSDNLEGTAISVSKDDGKTWSPLQHLFDAGRMHAKLVRLSNGVLAVTVVRRVDMRDGKVVGYHRGCEAVISRDNGETWETDHVITLDDLAYCDEENWVSCIDGRPMCGHMFSIALDDDSILTGYGNYAAGGALIRWSVPDLPPLPSGRGPG